MTFQFEDTRPEIASESILDDLRQVATNLGLRRLPQNRYRESGRFSSFLVKKRFGSWNRAVAAAGLDVDDSRRSIPDDELFDNLRAAWIALGRQPRKGEMAPPISRFGHDPYIRRFGGWLDAMRAFVDSRGSVGDLVPLEPGSGGSSIRQPSVGLRFQAMRRDGFRCVTCGRSPATHTGLVLHLDHVVPFSKGGRTELANLQTTCADCNLGKGDLL